MFTIPAKTFRKTAFWFVYAVSPFIQHTTNAQVHDLVFEHFTVEQGLSDNGVWSILQDRRGFMWFGTPNGLNKYDGYRFTVYKWNPLDSATLRAVNVGSLYEDKSGALWLKGPSNLITRFDRLTGKFTTHYALGPVGWMCDDSNGTLWVATSGKGLNRYERTSGTFTQYTLGNDTLFCIFADSRGAGKTLWVGGAGGLDAFDLGKETFTHAEQWAGYRVTAIHKDRAGTLWIGTHEGLYTFDETTGGSKRCPIPEWKASQSAYDHIHSFHEDSQGLLWIGAGDEVFRFERSTGKFMQYRPDAYPLPTPKRVLNPVCEDRRGLLWLKNLHKGISLLDPVSNTIVSYAHDPNDPSSLSDNAVNEVYEDRSGNLWIGTVWGGVNKLDRAQKPFRHYAHDPASPGSLTDNIVHGICEDRSGRVWVATRGGLERFDKKTGMITHFRHDPRDPHSLSSNIVRAVLEDHEGTIWVGTEACGLDRLDPADGRREGTGNVRFRHYAHDPGNPLSISSNRILSLFEDKSGKIWVGTADAGLDQFNKDSGIFVHHRSDPEDTNSLTSEWVNAICEDNKGGLWVGTAYTAEGMLNWLDRSTGKFTRFKQGRMNPGKAVGSIHSIYVNTGGTLWIGARHGLNRFDPSAGTFEQIEASRDIVGDFVTGILEDNSGRLWLKTNKGVSTFNPRTGESEVFNEADGVPINPTWGNACWKSRDGEMYFGGANGFVRFHPDSIKDNPYVPPVLITDFKIFDQSVSLDTVISEKTVLQLSHRDDVISFEFVALNYTSPEKNQYAYKLEGFDEEWTYCGTRRYASYTNLDAGSYMFRVRGSNNDGVWNEEGTSVAVIIAPPWWKMTWAYVGYAVVGLLLLYGLRRYELNRTLLKHQLEMKNFEAEKLREVDAMKMRFFANISHEFRTPLTLILGPVEKLLMRTERTADREDLDVVRRSALRLLELISQIMDISKLEAGGMKMQVEALDLVPFLRAIVLSFASLAERKHIHLEFRPAEEATTGYFDRDKLQKIVSNLLSNAIKFTPEGGEVSVRVSVSSGENHSPDPAKRYVEIVVSDTGAGVSKKDIEQIFDRFSQADHTQGKEHTGTGIGLALTKELVEVHRGGISVTSEQGRGSTFHVRLPLGREHWNEEEIAGGVEDAEGSEVAVVLSPLQVPGEEDTGYRDRSADELAGTDRPLLLIVEDNKDVLRYIRGSLEQQYRIEESVDGVAGLDAALGRVPDLVVSDIMMPRMDGIELCRRLKTDERTSHIPVILLTARATDAGKLEGLETGADDYIIKPFDVKELQVRIRNLIELRRKLQEKYRRQCVLEPGDIPIESMDEKFLRKALEVVEQHLSEPDFETAVLAREVCMSRMQLNRKLHALTGSSTHQFIRNLRLQRAAKLLASHWGNVTEVAYEVGFSSLSSFARAFREQYGVAPSEYGAHHLDSA